MNVRYVVSVSLDVYVCADWPNCCCHLFSGLSMNAIHRSVHLSKANLLRMFHCLVGVIVLNLCKFFVTRTTSIMHQPQCLICGMSLCIGLAMLCFCSKTVFLPSYCQISTNLDKILQTPIVVRNTFVGRLRP